MSKNIEISLNSILRIPITLVKCCGIAIMTIVVGMCALLMVMALRESIIHTTATAFWSMTWFLTKWITGIIAFCVMCEFVSRLWDKDYKIKIPLYRKVKLAKAKVIRK